jgi:ankyrin repeat protein
MLRKIVSLFEKKPKFLPIFSELDIVGGESLNKDFKGINELNEANQNGETLFNYYSFFCKLEAMKLLADNGAKINTKDLKGITPLHNVCNGWGDVEMKLSCVHYLFCKSVNFNELDVFGRTALHYSCEKPELNELSKLIIKYGVDVSIADHSGSTAIHYAKRYDNYELVEYMQTILEQKVLQADIKNSVKESRKKQRL